MTGNHSHLPSLPLRLSALQILGLRNPAEGDWIYYVLQDEQGNHLFTDSFQEFNRAKRECARLGLGCG